MRKRTLSWVSIVSLSLVSLILFALASAARLEAASTGLLPAVSDGIYASRRNDGVINAAVQGIFGPNICTMFGDPYSPLNSVWAPGPYTYTYRIRIPADYPSDIIRVELFDPDTINNAIITTDIMHTQTAVSQGMPTIETLDCDPLNNQRDTCILNTKELTTTGLALDEINPLWLVRVDENRGSGLDDGDGNCGTPSTYTVRFNTQTKFQLYYEADLGGSAQQVLLAGYTGQVGDGVRDGGEHDTDLRWVSPGAPNSFDQVTAVPTDCGSPNGGDFDAITCPGGTPTGSGNGFEVSLSQDLSNIVTEPYSGARYLYLDITTIDGASNNGFEIWAGPPDDVNTIASEVNRRNLQILDAPGSHSAEGIAVFTSDYLPQSALTPFRAEYPLVYLGPEYAGASIPISLFDTDTKTQPPITFTLDSLASTDWALIFGVPGLDDPDGVAAGVRCTPGLCNNQWVTPPYTITLPGDMSACDWLNPNPADCTPFYGGRLQGSIDSGGIYKDTFGWQITVPQALAGDPLLGCTAVPIAVHDFIRSVTSPSGTNPYPDTADFDYPATPPSYNSFVGHVPDTPLALAKEGDVFKMTPGFNAGNFGWLLWNEGRSADAATLAASLTWPGDSIDYADHGDAGTPVGSFTHVVRGYVNPINTTDVTLNLVNPVLASSGTIQDAAVQTAVNDHIDTARVLRLPLWDTAVAANSQYQMSGFALFRIIGYGSTSGQDWLLLEFIRHDASCGQQPPTNITLRGLEATSAPFPLIWVAIVCLGTAVGIFFKTRRFAGTN